MRFKESLSFHPFLFAIFPTIFLFSMNIQEIKLEEVIQLIIIILIITVALLFFVSIFVKNKKSPSFIISIGVILFFSYGHIYNLIGDNFEIRHVYFISIFIGLFILSIIYFLKTNRRLNNSTKITNVIAVTLVTISLINIGSETLQGNYSFNLMNFGAENDFKTVTNIDDKPDVYYIILDSYAGHEILDEYFGFSNQEFISFLEEKGFYVVDNAFSNYPATWLSLSSSLNTKYHDCQNLFDTCMNVGPHLQQIQNNQVMKKFKSHGYRVVNLFSGLAPTNNFDIATNLCGKYSSILNSELMINLISKSMLNPVYVKLYEDNKREQILCVLSELEYLQDDFDEPIFVFAHILLPHNPFVFGPNGEPLTPKKIETAFENVGDTPDEYLNQVKFANKKMKEVITKILSKSKIPPIIIIQGDHGLQVTVDDIFNPTKKELRESMSILNAYYLPEKNEVLYDTITPVNSFRLIFNEYLDEDIELLDDINYWPLVSNFRDVTNFIRS